MVNAASTTCTHHNAVETWLTSIGLAYAHAHFVAAGLDTAESLADLHPTSFAALGVTEPADRRKLFYLVQRVKQAQAAAASQSLSHDDPQPHQISSSIAEEEEESAVTHPPPPPPRTTTTVLPPPLSTATSTDTEYPPEPPKRTSTPSTHTPPRVDTGRNASSSQLFSSSAAAAESQPTFQPLPPPPPPPPPPHLQKYAQPNQNPNIVNRRRLSGVPPPRTKSTKTKIRTSTTTEGTSIINGRDNRSTAVNTAAADAIASEKKSVSIPVPVVVPNDKERGVMVRKEEMKENEDGDPATAALAFVRPKMMIASSSSHQVPVVPNQRTNTQQGQSYSRRSQPSSQSNSATATNTPVNNSINNHPTSDPPPPKHPKHPNHHHHRHPHRQRQMTPTEEAPSSLSVSSSASSNTSNARSTPATATATAVTKCSTQSTTTTASTLSNSSLTASWAALSNQLDELKRRNELNTKINNTKSTAAAAAAAATTSSSSSTNDGFSISPSPRVKVIVRKRPVHGLPQLPQPTTNASSTPSPIPHPSSSSSSSTSTRSPLRAARGSTVNVVQHSMDAVQCLPPHTLLLYQLRTRVDLRKEISETRFHFDHVCDHDTSNVHVYRAAVQPLVQQLFVKKPMPSTSSSSSSTTTTTTTIPPQCATIFCFGQTGSGKTHTLLGSASPQQRNNNVNANHDHRTLNNSPHHHQHQHEPEPGLYLLAVNELFERLEECCSRKPPQLQPQHHQRRSRSSRENDRSRHGPSTVVTVSMLELYDRKVLDLLNDRTVVPCWEDVTGKVQFPGRTTHVIHNAHEAQARVEQGHALRVIGTTSKNAESSRSHAILQFHIQLEQEEEEEQEQIEQEQDREKLSEHRYRRHSMAPSKKATTRTTKIMRSSRTLTFIDLAGSERGADTALFSHSTRTEGAEINTSLLALKEVLRAMSSSSNGGEDNSNRHIPFRGSKLTHILKESLIDSHSRCVMIACVSPNMSHCEPTLNTLRYAHCLMEFRKSKTPLEKSQIRNGSGGTSSANRMANQRQPPCPPVKDLRRPPTLPPSQPIPKHASRSPLGSVNDFDNKIYDVSSPTARSSIVSISGHSEVSADASAVLDDLLSTPEHNYSDATDDEEYEDDDCGLPRSSTTTGSSVLDIPSAGAEPHSQSVVHGPAVHQAARQLIRTHEHVLAAMLSITKDEMALVCQQSSDANAQDMLQYMEETQNLQEQQLVYIAMLRKQLSDLYEAQEANGGNHYRHSNNNDSFEDLRD